MNEKLVLLEKLSNKLRQCLLASQLIPETRHQQCKNACELVRLTTRLLEVKHK